MLPSLALLIHLAERPQGGPVSHTALQKALGWVEYLEGHARRLYTTVLNPETTAARALAKRIQDGDLDNVFRFNKVAKFTARDIYKNHWQGLNRESTEIALKWLVDAVWVWEETVKTGGRPTVFYHLNPKVF